MYVNADWELPVYQVIGPIIRVHWNYSQRTIEGAEGEEPRVTYDCEEAVVPLDADRATFVALVNAEGGDGEALADGWFTVPQPMEGA